MDKEVIKITPPRLGDGHSQNITEGGCKTKRIEYIDAMRGFTMLLVVYSHISYFCLGMNVSNVFSYNTFFTQFRMPLFFFVSGFVFFKSTRFWNFESIYSFIRKKVWVQIVSPLIFLALCCFVRHSDILTALTSEFKGGYWFTFMLFEFFVLYITIDTILQTFRWTERTKDVVLIFVGFLVFLATRPTVMMSLRLPEILVGILGIPKMEYFIFFIIGTRVKRLFAYFERMLDNSTFMTSVIISIVLCEIAIFSIVGGGIVFSFAYLLAGMCGIVLTFGFFRKYQKAFNNDHRLGRIMQYVGRHTLDIYLLHYFFLINDCTSLLPSFGIANTPLLEFLTSFILSIYVIGLCLIISAIIDQSKFLSFYLFGRKQ